MRRELEKIGYLIGANIARASNPFTTNLSRHIVCSAKLKVKVTHQNQMRKFLKKQVDDLPSKNQALQSNIKTISFIIYK